MEGTLILVAESFSGRTDVGPNAGAIAHALGDPLLVDADAGLVGDFAERRIRQPAGAGELAHHEGDVDQQGAGGDARHDESKCFQYDFLETLARLDEPRQREAAWTAAQSC